MSKIEVIEQSPKGTEAVVHIRRLADEKLLAVFGLSKREPTFLPFYLSDEYTEEFLAKRNEIKAWLLESVMDND